MWPFTRKPKNTSKARDEPRKRTKARERQATSKTSSGRRVTFRGIFRVHADNTLRGNEAIYAAVSRIANTVASMPLHLYKGNKLQQEHPLEHLLSLQPNLNFSPFGFLQTMEIYRNTEGNAYALIVPDKLGATQRLDILDPARVQPMRHPDTGEMWYTITLDDSKTYPVPGCTMLVLKHMSANGEIGIRPLDVLRASLDYDAQVKELSLRQLDGVNQGIFLTVPNAALGSEQREQAINDFLDAYEKSAGRVVVLEGGMTASTFNNSAIDAQLLNVERITRNRVATVYNIPPHLLGEYTDANYNTAEQTMREFLQLTILPIARQWEQELNRKLLTPADYAAGYRIRFDMDELSRADTTAMADKYQKAIRGGWMVPNEVREREGLPPDPYGNALMFSRDLVPASVATEHPELLLGGKASAASGEKGA